MIAARKNHELWSVLMVWLVTLMAMLIVTYSVGADTNWDLMNYHYYNGYARLNGGFDRHFFPAQMQSWNNPLLDEGIVWLMLHLPSLMVAAVITFAQSLNAPLLYIIARRVFGDKDRFAPWLSVAVGITGPMVISEIGATMGDNIVSLFIMGTLVLIGYAHDKKCSTPDFFIFIAGLLAGAGVGAKLVAIIYMPGVLLAVLMLATAQRRLRHLLLYTIGATVGFALIGGGWMWGVWRTTGNPVFPLMNNLFHSPLFSYVNLADPRFRPHDIQSVILFPVLTAFGYHPGAEHYFRDVRPLVAFILLPFALWNRPRGKAGALCLFYYVSGALWLGLFGIERYAVPLELLSGIVFLFLVRHLLQAVLAKKAVIAVAVIMLATTVPTNWGHLKWSRIGLNGNWFDVRIADELVAPDEMFLMLDDFPSSYAVPFFPVDATFVRMEGNMNLAPETGLFKQRLEAIGQHRGTIFTFGPHPPDGAQQEMLARYGLFIGQNPCLPVFSNVGGLVVCPLGREQR